MIRFLTNAELQSPDAPTQQGERMSAREFERRVVAFGHAAREVFQEVEMRVTHSFAPGIYMREIFMPAGALVIGNLHRTSHFNTIVSGACHVLINGETHDLQAGDTLISKAGARKMLLIYEDCRWQTWHANPDDCRDIATLEARIVDKAAGNQADPALLATFREIVPTFDTLITDPKKLNQ